MFCIDEGGGCGIISFHKFSSSILNSIFFFAFISIVSSVWLHQLGIFK